ncbi:MAG: hypothetical protein ACMUIM_02715 [bacterium]
MANYRVILKGLVDNTEAGKLAFIKRFAAAYKLDSENAKRHLINSKGIIYECEDLEKAQKGKAFLERLGGVAEIITEQDSPIPSKIENETDTRPCPKCGYSVPVEFEECPKCRIFIKKYEKVIALKKGDSIETRTNALEEKNLNSKADQSGEVKTAAQADQGNLSMYLSTHDLGEIIRDTVEIYRKNFLTLFLIQLMSLLFSFILGIPAVFIIPISALLGPSGIIIGATIFLLIFIPGIVYINFYCLSAEIIAISDIIYGRIPTFTGSLRQVNPSLPLKLFATVFLVSILFLLCLLPGGFILFIGWPSLFLIGISIILLILGLLYIVILAFLINPVVILEDIWSFDAIKRSKDLGKDFYIRNLCIAGLIALIIGTVVLIISAPLFVIPILGNIFQGALQMAAAPIAIIVLVLLYYDMRFRKEPENITQTALS